MNFSLHLTGYIFSVHHDSRRAHAPTIGDLKWVKRILRYLAGSANLKLVMYCDDELNLPLRIEFFTDGNISGSKRDKKSVSGGITRVNGMITVWH